jgi:transketolase
LKCKTEELIEISKNIRKSVVSTINKCGDGHPAPALSVADIFTVLYFDTLNINPKDPEWEDRDRLILSKGHAYTALYAVLAERGYFSKDILCTLRSINSVLQGHPDMKKTPGVDFTSGSLGHGLSAGVGMALGAKIDNKPFNVYVIIGDGESQEGLIWEGAMAAGNYGLDNLICILDYNKNQQGGKVKDIMDLEPVKEKWESFKWHVQEINGHDVESLKQTFDNFKSIKGKPKFVIANTIKGKGISFIENNNAWHKRIPTEEELEKALKELQKGDENYGNGSS